MPNSILSKAEGTEFGIVVCGCKGYFIESNVDKLWHFQDLYGLIIGIIDTCWKEAGGDGIFAGVLVSLYMIRYIMSVKEN